MIEGVCECQGNGLKELSNQDLIGLLNTFKRAGKYEHMMRLAIIGELRRRELSNLDLIGVLNTLQRNGEYELSTRMGILKELQRRYDDA